MIILRIALVLVALIIGSPAIASDYGICAEAISAETLIAPAEPIKSATAVSPEILILLVEGLEDRSDSIVPVQKPYYNNDELYAALSDYFIEYGAWIGVVEGTDGDGDPALWMHVYAATSETCVVSTVDNRVYGERSNAPTVFWEAIYSWDQEHPEGALYRYDQAMMLLYQ